MANNNNVGATYAESKPVKVSTIWNQNLRATGHKQPSRLYTRVNQQCSCFASVFSRKLSLQFLSMECCYSPLVWYCLIQITFLSNKLLKNAICFSLSFNSTHIHTCVQGVIPFLPGKSHGQRSMVGYHSWGHKESDMTERLHFQFIF